MLEDEEGEFEPESVEDCFRHLSEEAKLLYLGSSVPVLDVPPSPLEFYREYVSANRPVLVKNAVSHWPALTAWADMNYWKEKYGDKEVTVALTPNGLADSPVGDS